MTNKNSSPTKARLQQKLKQKNEAITSLEQQALYNKLKDDISAKYIYKKGTSIPSKAQKNKQHNETINSELSKLNNNWYKVLKNLLKMLYLFLVSNYLFYQKKNLKKSL
jgi:hypothetical protein